MAGAWLKTHPSARDLLAPVSFDAEALWHMLRLYCASKGNDGQMPQAEVPVAVQRKVAGRRLTAAVQELVSAGLVVVHGDTYSLPGWLDEQPPAAVWSDDTQRERWARNKALLRDRGLCKTVKERDFNRCRYCGVRVNWEDRKGAQGGTYDHVDPDGTNSPENVVVSCRRCNGRKKDRTPEQASMPLLLVADVRRMAVDEERARASRSDRDQTGIRPGSDPGSDSLTRARETGPGQIGAGSGSDRTDDSDWEPGHAPT